MCGGCIEIEKRLYACMEKDLGLICDLNTYKNTQRGRNVFSHPKGNEMLLNMCETINALDKFHVDVMSRVYGGSCHGKKFYETNMNLDNFLLYSPLYHFLYFQLIYS